MTRRNSRRRQSGPGSTKHNRQSKPDRSRFSEGLEQRIIEESLRGGILRQTLDLESGQYCNRWFWLMKILGDEYGYEAIRERDAEDARLTRFRMRKPTGDGHISLR